MPIFLQPSSGKEAEAKIREITQELDSSPAKQRIIKAKSLARNPKFARLVKEKSSYICEICGQKPFIQKNGLPYAEDAKVPDLSRKNLDW